MAWSPARCLWPASGPVSIVSSPWGPAPTAAAPAWALLAGIATVSGRAGGAGGGGCHAGISVVGSRSAPPVSIGGRATIVSATSISAATRGACQGAPGGSADAGSTGDAWAASAPAARSASVEAAGADSAAAAADQAGAGEFQGGGAGVAGGTSDAAEAAGAPHDGA